jgi:Uma2 family endonuclease
MAAMHAPARYHYTFAEYLAFERATDAKHEYVDGLIIAMAGGSRRHNALALRVGAALDGLRERGCVAFQSDQQVRSLPTGRVRYPDVTVVCGPIEGDPADPSGIIITNPTLLVEVLSPSTEEEDRGEKWHDYQQIPALQEYVLVSQFSPRIERYRRQANGTWEYLDVAQGSVELVHGGALDLERLYADLPD